LYFAQNQNVSEKKKTHFKQFFSLAAFVAKFAHLKNDVHLFGNKDYSVVAIKNNPFKKTSSSFN
jgi:hypothetical protein